jgi:hypothetical protein
MATEMKRASLVIVTSSVFERGIEDGITWHFHGDTPGRPMTEEDVIDFLTGNFIELTLEGYVDEERLRSNAGFLIGWLGAQAHIQVLPLSPGS